MGCFPPFRVLDFGCGSGRAVYEFRDAGFDAYGFDIHDTLILRDRKDRDFFRIFNARVSSDTSDARINESDYGLPYPDGFFDVVVSTSTLEHVQNHDIAFAEMARITKPGGIGIHTYPAKYTVRESHIYVPLGTMIQTYWWFRLWAELGIRNEYQTGKPAAEVAKINTDYALAGLSYPSPVKTLQMAQRYFTQVTFRPDLWHYNSRCGHFMALSSRLRSIYTRCGLCCLFTVR